VSNTNQTDITSLLPELNGGVFEGQINRAISDCAANVVTHGKKGVVTIKLEIEQIGETHQITMKHSLKVDMPTLRGKIVEESSTDTALHVGSGGAITLLPNVQTRMELGAGAATGVGKHVN